MSNRPTRENRIHVLVTLLAVASFAAVGGCGDDSTTAPDDDSGEDPIELTIELDSSTAVQPGERLGIDGIPADVDFAFALVTTAGDEEASVDGVRRADADTSAAHIERTEDGDELVVPFHPATPMQGGTVRIEVVDGERITSNRVTLEVAPLPSAPGAFAGLVTKLETLLDTWCAHLGTTTEILRSTSADQLSPIELNVYLMHVAIDHPENPNSLRAFAEGDIPLAEGAPVARDVLDGLASISGISGYLDESIAFVDTLTPPSTAFAARPFARSLPTAGRRVECFDGPDFDIDSDDCATLAEVMAYQAELRVEQASAVGKINDDVIDTIASALGFFGGSMIAWGITNTVWAADNIQAGSTGVYPSRFLSDRTDFDADPEEFAEDYTAIGRWSDFRVTAVSDGWQFDGVLKDALSKATGLRNSGWDSNANAFFDKAMEKTYEDYEKHIEKTAKNAVYDQVKSQLEIDELTRLEYCSQIWVNIDCTGRPYSVASSPALDVDDEELTYEPDAVGETTLEVMTGDVFGLTVPTAETKQIETGRIEVFVDPFEARAGTNVWVTFRARVENAEDTTVEWYTEDTLPADLQTSPDSARVLTPAEAWSPPIQVKARSLAATGLRTNVVNSDPREGSAPLSYGDALVIVEPTGLCLEPRETQGFSATVFGLDDTSVTWSTDPPGTGSFEGDVYTAPNDAVGTVGIVATADAAPDVQGYAVVRVASCECWWSAVVSGERSFRWSGSNAVWSDDQFGTFSMTLEEQVSGPGIHYPVITGFVAANVDPGTTGTWPFVGTVELDDATLWNPGDPDSDAVPELTIVSNDGARIEGLLSGPFFRPVPEGEGIRFETIHVTARFAATDAALGVCTD